MVFAFQMNLSGELRRSVFESAINEALTHHPLLCAIVKKNSQKDPVWVPANELRPLVDWNVLSVPINSSNNDGIDLEREVGLRVWVRQGDGTAELTMQFHHACCDGIGALRFIGHVLAAYGMKTASTDRRPVLIPYNPLCLLKRGQHAAQSATHGNRPGKFWAGIRDAPGGLAASRRFLCPQNQIRL